MGQRLPMPFQTPKSTESRKALLSPHSLNEPSPMAAGSKSTTGDPVKDQQSNRPPPGQTAREREQDELRRRMESPRYQQGHAHTHDSKSVRTDSILQEHYETDLDRDKVLAPDYGQAPLISSTYRQDPAFNLYNDRQANAVSSSAHMASVAGPSRLPFQSSTNPPHPRSAQSNKPLDPLATAEGGHDASEDEIDLRPPPGVRDDFVASELAKADKLQSLNMGPRAFHNIAGPNRPQGASFAAAADDIQDSTTVHSHDYAVQSTHQPAAPGASSSSPRRPHSPQRGNTNPHLNTDFQTAPERMHKQLLDIFSVQLEIARAHAELEGISMADGTSADSTVDEESDDELGLKSPWAPGGKALVSPMERFAKHDNQDKAKATEGMVNAALASTKPPKPLQRTYTDDGSRSGESTQPTSPKSNPRSPGRSTDENVKKPSFHREKQVENIVGKVSGFELSHL